MRFRGGQGRCDFSRGAMGFSSPSIPTMAAFIAGLLALFARGVDGTVVLTTPLNESLPFSNTEAAFAPRVPQAGILGLLYISDPIDACEPLSNGPALDQSPYASFVLVERGVCKFDVKVRHAQNAGFSAVIVYNNEDGRDLVFMSGDSYGIEIPAVFVSKAAGAVLSKYAGDPETRCYIFPTLEYPVWSVMAVAFISLLAVTAVLATFFFVRRHRLRRLGSRLLLQREPPGLTSAEIKALPTMIFKRTDDVANVETCVICMEEYEHGQKLRILPCRHAFHAACVDQWLLTRKPFCPVCKRDAHIKSEGASMSENTPLLTARFPLPIVSSAPAATQTSPTGSPASNSSSNNSSNIFTCSCSPIQVPPHHHDSNGNGLHRSSSLTHYPVQASSSTPGRTASSWPSSSNHHHLQV